MPSDIKNFARFIAGYNAVECMQCSTKPLAYVPDTFTRPLMSDDKRWVGRELDDTEYCSEKDGQGCCECSGKHRVNKMRTTKITF